MMPLGTLALRSAWNRRFVLALVVLSIALSTLLLLGIERLRRDVRDTFSQAVSGTDLIVGARTGPVQLLLYSVFHLGNATNNIRWSSVQALALGQGRAPVQPASQQDAGAFLRQRHHGARHMGGGAAGLVDEVADEVVGDVAEMFGGEHRIGELIERFGVHLLDRLDQVVEADGAGNRVGG